MRFRFEAILSSDWNECLAPCGPFDALAFNFPTLEVELGDIFRLYTGNRISLADAIRHIEKMLPHPITRAQMDAYLAESFTTYTGVPNLIDWCLSKNILFMINTTGMIGYFQRVFARNLLPRVPVISAHPMIRFSPRTDDPQYIYEVFEVGDKGKNTAQVARTMGIPAEKVIIMGDSGGDGPHFGWGAKAGAFLIGSMTKTSLDSYCLKRNIRINHRFGIDYSNSKQQNQQNEMQVNFMDLTATLEEILKNHQFAV